MQERGSSNKNCGLSVLFPELRPVWQQTTSDAQLCLGHEKPSRSGEIFKDVYLSLKSGILVEMLTKRHEGKSVKVLTESATPEPFRAGHGILSLAYP